MRVPLLCRGRPAVEYFTGKGSVLGSLTPQVVQASLNVAPGLVELLRDK